MKPPTASPLAWQSAIGYQLLASGYCLSALGPPTAGPLPWQSAIGNSSPQSKFKNRKSKITSHLHLFDPHLFDKFRFRIPAPIGNRQSAISISLASSGFSA